MVSILQKEKYYISLEINIYILHITEYFTCTVLVIILPHTKFTDQNINSIREDIFKVHFVFTNLSPMSSIDPGDIINTH